MQNTDAKRKNNLQISMKKTGKTGCDNYINVHFFFFFLIFLLPIDILKWKTVKKQQKN